MSDLIDKDWCNENLKREPHCWGLPARSLFLYQNTTGLLNNVWTVFKVLEGGDEINICHVQTIEELNRVLGMFQSVESMRDAILHERGPMEGMDFGSDRVNAVLGLVDDHLSQSEAFG